MFQLNAPSPSAWLDAVLSDFDAFLLDHASCEKKASSMAMTFISHYPDRTRLVRSMLDLSIEELNHFKEVVKILLSRGLQLGPDQKDPYVIALFKTTRKGSERYFMDRLILASIIEARGHERFGLVAEALEAGPLKSFYRAITQSEGRHLDLFIKLACHYFPEDDVMARTDHLLDVEANILLDLPFRAALH